jgi:23S rRNA-/tRNA-specific pseudouridylate synthase
VAKTREAAAGICSQLKDRLVKKTYHAIVVGLV